jgi:hypothetical protein
MSNVDKQFDICFIDNCEKISSSNRINLFILLEEEWMKDNYEKVFGKYHLVKEKYISCMIIFALSRPKTNHGGDLMR